MDWDWNGQMRTRPRPGPGPGPGPGPNSGPAGRDLYSRLPDRRPGRRPPPPQDRRPRPRSADRGAPPRMRDRERERERGYYTQERDRRGPKHLPRTAMDDRPPARGQGPGRNTIEAQEIVSGMKEDDMRRVLIGILRRSDVMRSRAKELNHEGVRREAPPPEQPRANQWGRREAPPPEQKRAANQTELKKWDNVQDLAQFEHGQKKNQPANGDVNYSDNFWNKHEEVTMQEKMKPVDWGETAQIDFTSEKTYNLRQETGFETRTEDDSGWQFD